MFCSILIFHVRDMLFLDIFALFYMVLDCLRVVDVFEVVVHADGFRWF